MTQKRATPTVKRRRVGAQLRRWREEAAGLKPGEGARAVGWDQPKLSRVERGVYTVSAEDVRHLAFTYGISDVAAVDEVARAAEVPPGTGWWAPYANTISPAYLDFIELESEADTIRVEHPVVVPGTVQAPGYAREIIARSPQSITAEHAEKLISIRLARQEILTRTNKPVKFHALVPESALHATFASGRGIMRDQLRKLLDVSELPNTKVQIVPLTAHPTYGSNSSMTILTFNHPWAPVASIDNPMGGNHTEDPEQVRILEAEFDHIASAALPVDKSRDLLIEYVERLHK
ncbi:helix-turn-helix domain-containing protein [Streptomyces sp. NPDC058290]|uniref:helix-turn-helix domain-containing protein n=1 Tax=Streptomyces sp. NPDC058290 TaxID=3346426 RepID=UPI0036F0ECD1